MLKDSTNPLNKDTTIENNQLSNSNSKEGTVNSAKELKEKVQIFRISLKKNNIEDKIKKLSLPEGSNSDTSLKVTTRGNLYFNIQQQNDILMDKKERYILEQKMKKDLNNAYKEIKIEKIKSNNFINKTNNNKNKYSTAIFNQINKNKNYLLKKLIIIQIPLLFLVCFNIILYKILNNINNLNEFNLYISSLSLSSSLSFFNFLLIILILFGILRYYYTSNAFRFLCLINFCLSISLLIIHIILIINYKSYIKIETEKKTTKFLVYFLFFSVTAISTLINVPLGIIAKDSFLIIGGCKNENACPERKIKDKKRKTKGKYVYFKDDIEDTDININTLKKFHACIYSNNN